MRMNTIEAKHFEIIIKTLKKFGIEISKYTNEVKQTFGYSFENDCYELMVLLNKAESAFNLLGSESPSHVFMDDDNTIKAHVHYHYGYYTFWIPMYEDITFEFTWSSKFTLEITAIEVVKFVGVNSAGGHDSVTLVCNLPCPTYPFEGQTRLKIEIPKSHIDDYLANNFPSVPVTVIEV